MDGRTDRAQWPIAVAFNSLLYVFPGALTTSTSDQEVQLA